MRLLKFKEFSALLEGFISEGSKFNTTVNRQPFWDFYYDNISKQKPKNTKTKEIIRADFGNNEGEAEENIKKMFKGLDIEFSSIGMFPPGIIRDGDVLGSDSYYTYLIKSPSGDEYYITNNFQLADEDGNQVEIGKKDLTPKKLQLEGVKYKNLGELMNVLPLKIERISKELGLSDSTKEFLGVLMDDVSKKPTAKFGSMKKFFEIGKVSEIINISKNFRLDKKTLANITNDFGEVLDAIYLLKTIQKFDKGLEFPSSESEGLSDMWVDGWNVSAKASKGGGKPSIDALVKLISTMDEQGKEISFDTPEESDLYNMLYELSLLKGRKSTLPTVESYTLIAKKLIDNGKLKDSGFEYMINFLNIRLGLDPIHRKTLLDALSREGKKDEKALSEFFSNYFLKCNFEPAKEFDVKSFIKMPKKFEGIVYYPMAVEIARCLNENYSESLVNLINKILVVKQMYLNINLTNETIEFTSTSSDSIKNAKFNARGSSVQFNAGLGFVMKK